MTRVCDCCNRPQPLEAFERHGRTGRRKTCRDCRSLTREQRSFLRLLPRTRLCLVCGVEKPLDEFSPRRSGLRSCRQCQAGLYGRRYARRHPRQVKALWLRRHHALMRTCDHDDCLILGVQAIVQRRHPSPSCYLCGRPLSWSQIAGEPGHAHYEHVHPLSRGGIHCADNVLPACPGCNRAKAGRLLTEFRPDLDHLDRCCPSSRDVVARSIGAT